MSRPAVALLAAVVLVTTPVHGQTPDPPRAFLLFIDELHLDFRQTPRTRRLMQRIVREIPRDGDVWAVVTTGTSSVNVPPTTDLAALNAAVSRVTGNALKPAERLLPPPGTNGATEQQHRADISYATGARAIESLAAAAPGAAVTVIYISEGYDTRRVTGVRPLIDAIVRARATIFVIQPWGVVEAVSAGVPPTDWNAYVEATQASLRTLAQETGGIAVFSQAEFDAELARRSKP